MTRPLTSVVTGAGGDMGSACALALAPTVDVLVLTDIDEARLEATARRVEREAGTKVDALVGDIGDRALVEGLVARCDAAGELHALVHTAGLSPSMAGWREIVRVDLAAVPLLLGSFLPSVMPGSVAVCVASIAGHMGDFDPAMDEVCDDPLAPDFEARLVACAGAEPSPGDMYRIAKRALLRYCERVAVPWGARGGRVVSLSPGLIDTGMGRMELEQNDIKYWLAAQTPVGGGRTGPDTVLPGLVDDIAQTVAFLCSDQAAFISGCDIRVDGGLVGALRHQESGA